MANIYMAKLNVNEKIHDVYDDKIKLRTLLVNLFKDIDESKVVVNENTGVKYKIVNLEKDPQNYIIRGRFIRIYESLEQDFYDEKEDQLTQRVLENPADYIAFTFYVLREIIAFVPKQKFSRQHFLKIFGDFLSKSSEQLGEVNLQIKFDNDTIDKKFSRIKNLKEISVVIVPPNGDRDLWKGLEDIGEQLEDSRAKKISMNLTATLSNPLDKSSDLVQGFVKFVKNSYGNLKAIGQDNQKSTIEIDTKNDESVIEKHEIKDKLKNSPREIQEEIESKNIL